MAYFIQRFLLVRENQWSDYITHNAMSTTDELKMEASISELPGSISIRIRIRFWKGALFRSIYTERRNSKRRNPEVDSVPFAKSEEAMDARSVIAAALSEYRQLLSNYVLHLKNISEEDRRRRRYVCVFTSV